VKPDGTFQIWRLDPGKYRLVAMYGEPGQQQLQSAPMDVQVGTSNLDNIELHIAPPGDIHGQLEYDDERARAAEAESQRPAAPPRTQPRQVSLRGIGGDGIFGQAEIAADGSFAWKDVPPDRYDVTVSWMPAYVKSMRYGDSQIEGEVLDVRNGVSSGVLNVRVSSATAEISGVVRDDDGPVAGAVVAIVMATDSYANPFRPASITGPVGAYSWQGIAPGKYKLVALAHTRLPYMPAPSDECLDAAETIEVRANDKLTEDLKVCVAGEK